MYWTAWRPKNRCGGHRRRLGLLAPDAAVESARADANATAGQRATARAASARHRDRTEADYQAEMRSAIHQWLDFAAEHAELASDIPDGATAKATVVGSGRVGRTRTLSVDERAALAARAHIRHHHTDYEAQLDEATGPGGDDLDGGEYREIKRAAHITVEAFLTAHRRHKKTAAPPSDDLRVDPDVPLYFPLSTGVLVHIWYMTTPTGATTLSGDQVGARDRTVRSDRLKARRRVSETDIRAQASCRNG